MKQFLIYSFCRKGCHQRERQKAGAMLWYRTVVFKVLQSGEIPVLVFIGRDLSLSQISHFIGLGHKALSKK